MSRPEKKRRKKSPQQKPKSVSHGSSHQDRQPTDFQPGEVALPPRKVVLWLAIGTLVVLLPLVNKPVHLDDPVFIWRAQRIAEVPWDHSGIDLNWSGTTRRLADYVTNPPLMSYYFAVVGAVAGYDEIVLHLACFALAVLTVVATYQLGRRLCGRAELAALLALTAPVFVLSATTLMCDMLMLALWCWAVWFWIRGLDRKSHGDLFVAAALIALAALAKYYAVALIPLLAAYTIVRERSVPYRMAWLLLPMAVLGIYDLVTWNQYGRGLLLGAVLYSGEQTSTGALRADIPVLETSLVALVFLGGCLANTVFFWTGLWKWAGWLSLAIVAVASGLMISEASQLVGSKVPPPHQTAMWFNLHVIVMATIGAGVIGLVVAALSRQRDADTVLLSLWVLGTLTFTAYVNWSINGRSLLTAVPAVGILLVRQLEAHKSSLLNLRSWQPWAALAPGLLLGLWLAWADQQMAVAAKTAAEQITAKYSGTDASTPVWFQGHWGFQYYMQLNGGVPVDLRRDSIAVGEVMAIPENADNVIRLPENIVEELEVLRLGEGRLSATMSHGTGAAFYSTVHGTLPYSFGPVPLENYRVYRLLRRVNFKSEPDDPSGKAD